MHFHLTIPALKLTTHQQSASAAQPSQSTLPPKASHKEQAPNPKHQWNDRDTLEKPETSQVSGKQKVLLQAGIGQRGGYMTNCLSFGMAGAGLGAQYSAGNPYVVGGAAVAGCIVGMAAEYVDESQDTPNNNCTETTTETDTTEETNSSEAGATEVEESSASQETEEKAETDETGEDKDSTEDEEDDDLGCVYDGGAMVATTVDRLATQGAFKTQAFTQAQH